MRRSGSVVVLACLLAGCAYNYKGWVASKTRHATVYTNTEHQHRFTQEWIELSFAAFKALLPGVNMDRVEVLWVRDKGLPGNYGHVYGPNAAAPRGGGWNQFPEGAWVLETVPGDGQIGREGLIVMEARTGGSLELAHLFVARTIRRAPLWLHVGLAKYMSKHRVHRSGDQWFACFGSKVFDEMPEPTARFSPEILARMGGGIGNPGRTGSSGVSGGSVDAILPVAEVFTSDWYQYDKSSRYWFEYTSYALVHFLIHGRDGWHRERFNQFLRYLNQDKEPEEALGLAYPHILPTEWDDELAKHVRPSPKVAVRTRFRELPQGLCLKLPPLDYAEAKPTRTPVAEADIRDVMEDIERLPLHKRHAGWYPEDVVRAEAGPRPRRPGGGGSGDGSGTGSGMGTGGGGAGRGGVNDVRGTGTRGMGTTAPPASGGGAPTTPAPAEDPTIPGLREKAPNPPAAPPPAETTPAPPPPSDPEREATQP